MDKPYQIMTAGANPCQKSELLLFYAITVNLTSGWLGILVVSPGLFGFTSITEVWEQLQRNVPLAMIGFGVSYWLLKWSES